ncbi:MAG: NAD-dependent epimerase/dehydratase family protein [Myxococcales bacterium]|nr:NAD-dependent epimerase/dehydratase family protein [Myxococcales bacterium]
MRALVTGGAGFIGSHLVEALVARGDAVTVLDDFSTGHAENLAAVRADIRLVRGSVTEPADVAAAAAGADVIFHQAAVASVPRSVEEPAHTHAVNVGGTVQILDAARRLGVRRVILACSAAVYGDRSDAAREDDAPHPESPYAVEKLAAEHYLRMWPSIYGTETVSLRYFNVFGPRQDPASPYSGVVSVFVDRLRKGLPVTIYGDGEQTRDFVAVADVVRANLCAADVPDARGLVCNIARGQATTINALYGALADLLGGPAAAHGPARAGDVRRSLAEVSRARALLGFEAQVSVRDGLARLLAG